MQVPDLSIPWNGGPIPRHVQSVPARRRRMARVGADGAGRAAAGAGRHWVFGGDMSETATEWPQITAGAGPAGADMTSGATKRHPLAIPAGSSRIKAFIVGLAAVVLLVSAAGSRNMNEQPYTVTGHSIIADGPQENGLFGIDHAVVGRIYRFAFPLLFNNSDSPLTVTSVRLVSIPSGVNVISYAVYLTSVKDGYVLDGTDGDDSTTDMTRHENYQFSRLRISPHKESDYYAMVAVMVTHDPAGAMSGCRVNYRQANTDFTQLFRCQFLLHTGHSS